MEARDSLVKEAYPNQYQSPGPLPSLRLPSIGIALTYIPTTTEEGPKSVQQTKASEEPGTSVPELNTHQDEFETYIQAPCNPCRQHSFEEQNATGAESFKDVTVSMNAQVVS